MLALHVRQEPQSSSRGDALYSPCLAHGLVDEIEALVLPIIAGGGTSPFAAFTKSHQLRMLGIQSFESGAFVVRYAVA